MPNICFSPEVRSPCTLIIIFKLINNYNINVLLKHFQLLLKKNILYEVDMHVIRNQIWLSWYLLSALIVDLFQLIPKFWMVRLNCVTINTTEAMVVLNIFRQLWKTLKKIFHKPFNFLNVENISKDTLSSGT